MPRPKLSKRKYSTVSLLDQGGFRAALQEEARLVVRRMLRQIMMEEASALLEAHRNEVAVKGARPDEPVRRPKKASAREGEESVPIFSKQKKFYPQHLSECFPDYGPAAVQTITALLLEGVRQSEVGRVVEPWLRGTLRASTVSQLVRQLQAECHRWRTHPLQTHYPIIYMDAAYFSIMHGDQTDETPLLTAVGVDENGQKEMLNVLPAGQESMASWQAAVDELKRRGVRDVDLLVTDGGTGLITAARRAFPSAQCQRCLTHKVRNVLAHVPKRAKSELAASVRRVFSQSTKKLALTHAKLLCVRYQEVYPGAVASLLRDLESCLTFYNFPRVMWKHIRTNGALESLFLRIRLRTKTIGTFRNEASCLMIMYAVIRTIRFHRLPVWGHPPVEQT